MKIQGCKLRGEVWYSNLVIPGSGGKIHCVALSRDPGEAKRLRDEIRVGLQARDPRKLALCPASEMPIDVFVDKVLARYRKKDEGTYTMVKRAFFDLVARLPIKTAGDITPKALEDLRADWLRTGFVKADKNGNPIGKTNIPECNVRIKYILASMRWAEDDDEIKMPMQNWRKVSKAQWYSPTVRTLFYSPEQHAKLREDAARSLAGQRENKNGVMLTFYMLGYHAGLRLAEIRHLRREDINMELRQIYIREKNWIDADTGDVRHWAPKGSKQNRAKKRTVPMDMALHEYLVGWLSAIEGEWIMSLDKGMPISENSMSRAWSTVVAGTKENPGVGIGSAHTLRHCFATDWLKRGEPLENVQRFLGHEKITMTQDVYNHFIPTQFATAGR